MQGKRAVSTTLIKRPSVRDRKLPIRDVTHEPDGSALPSRQPQHPARMTERSCAQYYPAL
jgi:hypothetical protein